MYFRFHLTRPPPFAIPRRPAKRKQLVYSWINIVARAYWLCMHNINYKLAYKLQVILRSVFPVLVLDFSVVRGTE